MNFDWQTEEDEQQWEAEVAPNTAEPVKRRWPWLVVGLAGLLLVATGIVYARLEQRAAAVTAAIEADVLAAHDLVRQANERADGELFSSLLSSSDPAWSAVQRRAFDMKVVGGQAFWGLVDGTEPAERIQVSVAPDLQTAELFATHLFTVTSFNYPSQTVRLQKSFAYRLENGRWLLAPPAAEFWGRPVVNRGPRLTLTYPERDQEIGGRLAVYLEQIVGQLCAPAAQLGCPAGWQLEVNLATEPDTMLGPILRDGRGMKLPAPSLLGAPVDEAGYLALRRSYANALATWVIWEFSGFSCCGQDAVASTLLFRQLHLLGLQPWPMQPADYQAMWQHPVSLAQMAVYWNGQPGEGQPDEDWRPLYALVEFLGQIAPEAAPLELRRQAIASPSFEAWLREFLPYEQYSDAELDGQWLAFNAERLAVAETVAPIDLPADDLLLTCRADPSRLFDLVRYDLATGLWQYEVSERDFYALYGLPDRSGVLMMDQIAGLGGPLLSRVSLWQGGREQIVYTGPIFYYYSGQADASGRQLLLYGVGPENGESLVVVLDLANCSAAGCALQPVSETVLANVLGNVDQRLLPSRTRLLAALVETEANEWTGLLTQLGLESFIFSPDGRWLIANVTAPTRANTTPLWRQYLYDTQTDALSTFSFDSSFIYPEQDWAADGQWLARLGDGFLLLSAPGHEYQQVVVHPFFDCTNLVWVTE